MHSRPTEMSFFRSSSEADIGFDEKICENLISNFYHDVDPKLGFCVVYILVKFEILSNVFLEFASDTSSTFSSLNAAEKCCHNRSLIFHNGVPTQFIAPLRKCRGLVECPRQRFELVQFSLVCACVAVSIRVENWTRFEWEKMLEQLRQVLSPEGMIQFEQIGTWLESKEDFIFFNFSLPLTFSSYSVMSRKWERRIRCDEI